MSKATKLVALLLSLIVFISTSLIPLADSISAQSQRGLVVNEFFIDLGVLQPGATVNESFTVTYDYAANESGEYRTVNLSPRSVDFTQGEEPGVPQFLEPDDIPETARASEWIDYADESFTLSEPKQTKEIEFTLNIPDNAEPGGKYVALLVSNTEGNTATSELETTDSTGFGINSETGPLLFFTVAGDINAQLEVEEIYTKNIFDDRTWFFLNPPVDVVVRFRNTGNVHAAPAGRLFIHSDRNYVTDDSKLRYSLNPSQGFVLPGTSREFTYRFGSEKINKDGEVVEKQPFVRTVKDGDNYYDDYSFANLDNIIVGRYYATAVYDYENVNGERVGSNTLSTSFWVIPWQLLVALILIITGVIMYIYYLYRRKSRNKKDTHKEKSKK